MFAEVVLHRRTPKHFDYFTYAVPGNMNVKEGQIVRVPFRKRILVGIILKTHNRKPDYHTKTIASASAANLTDKQLALAFWMREKYECQFNKIFDLFMPENIWQEKTFDADLPAPPAQKNSGSSDAKIAELAANLLRENCAKLLFEASPLSRRALYQELSNALPKGGQGLFLLPEVFYLKKLAADYIPYHGSLKEKQKAAVWTAVHDGKIACIAATRLGLFLPFKKLSFIVVDFEHNENYSEKRQPNYDGIETAEKLAELWNIPLILISASPRVETWHKIKEKIKWMDGDGAGSVRRIDMENERKKGNWGILAQETIEKIAAALGQNKQTVLFLNKKGEAGALLCRDCGHISKCRSCSSALTLHAEHTLSCHRCRISIPAPIQCEKCAGKRLKPLGYGTEKLEQEIKKIFGKAKLLRIDQETAGGAKKRSQMLEEKNLADADIIIATQMINKPLFLPRLKLSAAVMPDRMLNYGDFRAEERLFQLLISLRNLAKNNEMLIQTYMPDHELYKILEENRPEKFYERELKARKSLSLPPFN